LRQRPRRRHWHATETKRAITINRSSDKWHQCVDLVTDDRRFGWYDDTKYRWWWCRVHEGKERNNNKAMR
jgi:hypothetical protein